MKLKKILITGSGGMLGHQACIFFKQYYKVLEFPREKLDITDSHAVNEVFNEIKPDIVLNCAVLRNEDCDKNYIKAYDINTIGTYNLAAKCKIHNSYFVHISTDYVFDGNKTDFYDEEDEPYPINKYGWSKYEGERLALQVNDKCFIIRTAWLYGKYGNNFVHKIIDLAKQKHEINVVCDQFGSPTSVAELIKIVNLIIKTNKFGIYHAVCSGKASRYEFAEKIIEIMGIDCKINGINNEALIKPRNTSLTNKKIYTNFNYKPIHWAEALKNYLGEVEVKNEDSIK